MCGFAGLFTTERLARERLLERVARMSGALEHRGPDDSGTWADAEAGVALGFRRLAILDLSELGHQPMTSASGRYVIIFNGEVYNFAVIRDELAAAGQTFRGGSDTEVILAAFERWGIAAAVPRFVGMFAMAVWDTRERTLTLVRDRLGIKPLYVSAGAGTVLFASELKALHGEPGFDRTIDPVAVSRFLRFLYIPGPGTIFRSARRLPPGHMVTIRDARAPLPEPVPYWSIEQVAADGLGRPFAGTDEEAIAKLEALLLDSVRLRMIADVPLGAFLSGGIDSTTVVALMQAASSRPVKTYSIAFREPEYNEAPYAAAIARHLGTDHHEIEVSGEDALAVVPRLAGIFDEPLADTSQIPLCLICAAARRDVTVALSGDGGDEVFAGYNRYTYGDRITRSVSRVPPSLRRGLAAAAGRVARPGENPAWRLASAAVGAALRERAPGERTAKIARLLREPTPARMYRALVSLWDVPEALVPAVLDDSGRFEHILENGGPGDLFDRMLLADQSTYLPDDQLVKVDRTSMAVSLEVRVPLLDHRVVEFSWGLPRRFKIRDGKGKWLLRQVLYRHVPAAMVERPKMGFSVPIDRWLRGPLREWAGDLLASDALERDGLLDAAPIHAAWRDLRAGRGDAGLGLWAVVMLQAWRERWGPGVP